MIVPNRLFRIPPLSPRDYTSVVLPALLSTLRDGTSSLHTRTEAAFVLSAPSVTRAEYTGVLSHLFAFYHAAESALAPWASTLSPYGLALAERRKAPLLARDLRALGGSPVAPAVPPLDLPSASHALGALYVTEGATLGGQLLRRRLGPSLGLTPSHGLAFLTAYGPAVGPMWKAFGAALERFDAALPSPERAGAHAHALDAARRTFETFEDAVVRPTARASLAVGA